MLIVKGVTFKRIFLGLFVFLVLVIVGLSAGAYTLPDQVIIKRYAVIKAPREKIFALVGDLNRVDEWSQWSKIDPNLKLNVTGEPGDGQTLTWASNNPSIGVGSEKVTIYQAPFIIKADIDLAAMGKAQSSWILLKQDDLSHVTYSMTFKLDSVMERWLGLIYNKAIGQELEHALAQVKRIVTAPDDTPPPAAP